MSKLEFHPRIKRLSAQNLISYLVDNQDQIDQMVMSIRWKEGGDSQLHSAMELRDLTFHRSVLNITIDKVLEGEVGEDVS